MIDENEEIVMDDELAWEDAVDLIKTYIESSVNEKFNPQKQDVATAYNERPAPHRRLCFVITKNKTSSWAEDLADCVSFEERNRVFN
ncbi:MAG: hypothetical protein VR65_12595 [Desulfobulbaceae bacterium BRH_c16a]|nr:MAG: hypothetical protein VR65_12595 [Desulfobulbaceae bacterium BRH_c16a]